MNRLLSRFPAASRVRQQLDKFQTGAEEEFYLRNLADNTKLGPNQGASLYRLLEDVAQSFRIPAPHVFLDTNPEANAWVLGGSNASVVLTSALVDTFPHRALRTVIAHELGHIICDHTFYRLLAQHLQLMVTLVTLIPILGPLLSLGFQIALLDWYRKSELSADRAALLGTQDLDAVRETILLLAGGATSLGAELNLDAFSEQAEEFRTLIEDKRRSGISDRIQFLFSELVLTQALNTHPWPAVRLEEITRWSQTEQYKLLSVGDYPGAAAAGAKLAETTSRRWADLVPPGEDAKEYVADVGRAARSAMQNLLRRPPMPRS